MKGGNCSPMIPPPKDDPPLSDQGVIIPLLGNDLIKRGQGLIQKGISPRLIKKVFETVCVDMVKRKIEDSAISVPDCHMKFRLTKFLATQLSKKLFGSCPEMIADIIVSAVHATGYDYDDIGPFEECLSDFEDGFNLIEIITVSGGSVGDSFFVEGIAFKSTASRGSKEHGVVENPKILLFDRYDGNVIDILDKCDKYSRFVVLSNQAIDGGTKKKLAKRGVYFGELVDEEYLDHVVAATDGGYVPRTKFSTFSNSHIGTCERFQQIQFGNEVFGICSGCPRGKTATIVLRGDDQFIEEAKMHVYGLIPEVRRLVKDRTLVAGGRSLYNDIIRYLSEEANNVDKDSKPIVKAFCKAIKTLSNKTCNNVGDNAVNNPSQKHAAVLGHEGDAVWEPPSVKISLIGLATEFACMNIKLPSNKGNGATSSKRKTKHTKKRKRCSTFWKIFP